MITNFIYYININKILNFNFNAFSFTFFNIFRNFNFKKCKFLPWKYNNYFDYNEFFKLALAHQDLQFVQAVTIQLILFEFKFFFLILQD